MLTALLVAAGSATAVASGPSVEPAGHYLYRFDQRRPLTLQPQRIAVYQRESQRAEKPRLADLGIGAADLTGWPIPGWSLAVTPPAARTGGGIADLVAAVAADESVDFVSPVFVGADGGPLIVTFDLLVGFRRDVAPGRAEAILGEAGAGVITHRTFAGMKGVYKLRSRARNGFEVLAAANALAERPEVSFAEPDMIFTGRGSAIPNDPGFSNCWGLHNTGQLGGTPDMDVDGPEAWDLTTGDSSIIVVVIDTGVQQDHPDLNQIPGTDSTDDTGGLGDGGPVNACDVHGTPVAGCVSAIIDNGLGTVGVAPGCVVASARTFISNTPGCNLSWSTQVSWTVQSLAWAESIGARVTNNSNFYGFMSSSIDQKYEDTRAAGMVHFSSAGNGASPLITYPASLPCINAVTALDRTGALASFSNFGSGLAFSAPGEDIYTTDRTGADGWSGGDYTFATGTSFASPFAAGIAALILSGNACLDADDVEQIMQQAAVDLGSPGYDTTFGWGFVNAHQSLVQTPGSTDVNGDGAVDVLDLIDLLLCFGQPAAGGCGSADVNGDGTINVLDLIDLLLDFGTICP